MTGRALAGADRHRDPAYVVGEGQGADDAGELLAGLLRRTPGRPASAGRGRPPPRGRPDGRRPRRRRRVDQRAVRVAELGDGADGGDQPGGAVVEGVVGHRERAARRARTTAGRAGRARGSGGAPAPRASAPARARRPRAARRGTARSAPGSRPAPRAAAVRSGGVGVGRERRDLVADAGQHARALGVDQRLVEPAEPDAAGQVADHREAQLGGPDEPLEEVARRAGQLLGRRRLGDPALEQLGRQLDLGGGALLRQEDPEDRLLQLRGPVQVGHAVVGEHPGQPVAELLGEPAPVDVEALQEGVEVLLGAVHAQLGVQVLPGGAVAAQLGEVGEQAEQLDLVGARRPRPPRRARRGRRGSRRGRRRPRVGSTS